MRLICPNCDAQYEVPDDVMPPEGRDVQCSNCGNTWYQGHPDEVIAAEAVADMEPQEDEEFVNFDTPEPEPVVEEDDDDARDTFEESPTPKPSEDRPMPTRRELDPAVADVLRAEAELEEQARRNEMGSMESQPELGLSEGSDDADKRAREARERMAKMRGETPAVASETTQDASTSADLGSRRSLLPDIEEINSTLRSNSDRSPTNDPGQTAQIEVQEQRSSRRGFVFAVALVSVLALAYSFAPQIADAVPQLESAMTTYVIMIDTWRDWLDAQVTNMLSWLDAAATSTDQ